MKAMVLEGASKVELEEVDRPRTDSGDTVVRVTHTGVCGTDYKIFTGGIPVAYPRIMGHEMIGEVAEAAGSDGPQAGSRVIVDPVYFCGDCFHCRVGQTNLCMNGGLIGRDRDGGFAEYLAAMPGNMFVIPDGVTDREAPLIQVLTTCLHAQQMAQMEPGQTVVVLGLGVTGLLHVQLARALGAKTVIGITRSAWKREVADSLGADVTMAPSDDMKDRILELTGGIGADLVIESVGSLYTLAQAIDYVRLGGRVLAYGIQTNTEGALPFYDLYFKEIQLVNARAATAKAVPECLELVNSGKVRLEPVISDVVPLDRLDDALDMVANEAPQRMKIILEHV
ncbi:MAG: alcohol dehydrogenase catalytic domain-containing protein [Alphaproteobacteria bacterium]